MKHYVNHQLDIDKGYQNTTDTTFKQVTNFLSLSPLNNQIPNKSRRQISINKYQLSNNVPFGS